MKTLLYAGCVCVLLFGTVAGSCAKKDMSMKMNEPRNIRGVVSYKRSFGDVNAVQLAVAKKIGIRPIASREEAEEMTERLVEISPCDWYDMDSLTHTLPYLIRKARAMRDPPGPN